MQFLTTILNRLRNRQQPESLDTDFAQRVAETRTALSNRFGLPESAITVDYVAGRIDAEDRETRHRIEIRNWQKVSGAMTVIALVSTVGFFIARQQPQIVPYVAVVDKLHRVVAMGVAAKISDDDLAAVKQDQIQRWLRDARTIIGDWPAVDLMLRSVIGRADGSAQTFLRGWYETTRPDKRGETETVTVAITNTLPRSHDTYELEWTEHVFSRSGASLRNEQWKGLFTVLLKPVPRLEDARLNPLNFKVTAIQWSKRSPQ